MQCPKCKYEPTMAEMQNSPGDCVKCGVNYQGHARHQEQVRLQNEQARAHQAALSPVVREVSAAYQGAQPVVVVDVRMSFWSMVVFMVKWVIASIPAGLILLALGSFIYGVVTALPAYMSASSAPPVASAAQSEPKRIAIPASMRGEFYEIGLARSDNFAVMAVKTVMPDGEVAFSRVSFDCANATAAIVAFARTLESLGPTSGPGSYEQITASTPRQHIAKHACAQMPVRHALLQ